MKHKDSERGAAAVEFALLLPVLLLLVIGIMEFGRAYNIQISASNAAREGARYAAVHYTTDAGSTNANAAAAAKNAAPSLPGSTTATVTYQLSNGAAASTCTTKGTVTVTVLPPRAWMTGYLPIPAPQITGRAVMQCGG